MVPSSFERGGQDGLGDVAGVESLRPFCGEQAKGFGEIGILEDLADLAALRHGRERRGAFGIALQFGGDAASNRRRSFQVRRIRFRRRRLRA